MPYSKTLQKLWFTDKWQVPEPEPELLEKCTRTNTQNKIILKKKEEKNPCVDMLNLLVQDYIHLPDIFTVQEKKKYRKKPQPRM